MTDERFKKGDLVKEKGDLIFDSSIGVINLVRSPYNISHPYNVHFYTKSSNTLFNYYVKEITRVYYNNR